MSWLNSYRSTECIVFCFSVSFVSNLSYEMCLNGYIIQSIDVPRPVSNDLWITLFQKVAA